MRSMQYFFGLVRFLASLPIRIYRTIISPVLPPSCIYTPTCSEYSIRSIMAHGVLKGSVLSLTRITRCVGAFFAGGEDPVPKTFSFRAIMRNYRMYRRPRRAGERLTSRCASHTHKNVDPDRDSALSDV